MKTIVRSLAVALAITGFAATTQISSAHTDAKFRAGMMSALPKPLCPPSDPSACQMVR